MYRLFLSLIVLVASVSAAKAECGPFPRSNFIGAFSHDQVADYVQRAHGGDWAPYISMLEANIDRLQDMSKSGGTKVLRVRGNQVQMRPKDLARFIYVSKQFKDVVECLAENEQALDFNNFATAAGGNEEAPKSTEALSRNVLPKTIALGNASSDTKVAVNVQITPICRDGDTVFQVQNIGSPWPDTGMFTMFRIDGSKRQMIGARRLTLGTGDYREFTVSESQNRTGHVGISVDPSWYKRSFKIDADARCG